jgi:hypothetical protein
MTGSVGRPLRSKHKGSADSARLHRPPELSFTTAKKNGGSSLDPPFCLQRLA